MMKKSKGNIRYLNTPSSIRDKYYQLSQFLGTCFYQMWSKYNKGDPNIAVDNYFIKKMRTLKNLTIAMYQLAEVLRKTDGKDQDLKDIIRALGSYYIPANLKEFRQAYHKVHRQMQEHLNIFD